MTRLLTLPICAVLVLALVSPARADTPSVIVKFRAGTRASVRHAVLARAGAGGTLGTVHGQGARVLAAREDSTVVAERLNAASSVLYAEPNAEVRALGAPNDPLLGEMRDLDAIRAPAAWDALGLGGFPATGGPAVGIVDSGIDAGHEDLAGKVQACATAAGGKIADGRCADDNGHGTHTAGTIGALAGNGVGIAGVAFASPLIVCKALGGPDGTGTLADVANCIRWTAARGARVISMSLGGPASTTIANAVRAAWKSGRRGGALLVAAAGNDGSSITEYPAGYPEVVSVAATDDNGKRAEFSNNNPDVELSAPGVDVLSAKLGGGYIRYSGTSMATPHVAGVAALALMAHPALGAAGLRARLDNAVQDLGAPGRDPLYGFGLVDAAAAVGQ